MVPAPLMWFPMEFREYSIMAWNVRGAFNKSSHVHMKNLVRGYNLTFLVIMKTHGVFESMRVFWGRLGFSPVSMVEVVGLIGAASGFSFFRPFHAGVCA